ncbi:hypothetical protein [Tautonia sociabilis]|uniref:Uncharacterized protein n=1 Tax=Tautonia sociabilis TaxID=2080755 RepID=A0A432MI27_9BACT|nr:hypothetical protein [Tautonia sociabilis]RUL86834.1 hypothetical protein TsocGM_15195 [Tautonia sociabilis]
MATDFETDARPEPLTARSLGLLNIVFGVLFLLGVGYEVGVVLTLPALGRLLEWAESQQQQQLDKAMQGQRDRFDERLKAAESDEEREVIEAERTRMELNAYQAPNMMPFSFDFLDTPRIRNGILAKGGVMLVLNLLLIASGIGLWKLRRWGRSLSVAVAGLLLPALAVFAVASAREAPTIAERWSAGMTKLLLEEENLEETPPELAEVMGRYEQGMKRLFTVSSATANGLAALYPIAVLVVASRPGVRAAVARPRAS